MLCFAVNSKASFRELKAIFEDARKMKAGNNIPCVVVGMISYYYELKKWKEISQTLKVNAK